MPPVAQTIALHEVLAAVPRLAGFRFSGITLRGLPTGNDFPHLPHTQICPFNGCLRRVASAFADRRQFLEQNLDLAGAPQTQGVPRGWLCVSGTAGRLPKK